MIHPGRTSNRSVSPRGREGSPSPYDFCNNNRSDDEDVACLHEAEDHNFRVPQAQRHNKQDEGQGSGRVDIDTSGSIYNNFLLNESNSHRGVPPMKAVTECDPEDNKDQSFNCLTTETGLHSPFKSPGVSARCYKGPEEGSDDNSFYASLYREPLAPYEGESPIDVENNASIWVPPPPEDEEDETGIGMGDDDDEDNVEGVWGLARSYGSLSGSEFPNAEKAASEEQRKAMRAVVDGHFRVLVAQLLSGEGIEAAGGGQESWLEIVTTLSLQAANVVKPDTSRGGGMDPGGYVKVKCVATGQRSESYVVKGIVCKKNVAHRRMTSRYNNPRLLLLGGALEYQKVSNQLSSLDTVLQQETDLLSVAVARIEALHPNVLLVEKTVPGHAQERLLAKEISLVLNVKRPLLERIARCTGADILSDLDHLTSAKSTKLGHCELFHVEKHVEEHGSASQGGKKLSKTLMYFEGCPKPLGCTILLKGSDGDELKKVKRAAQFAVFAAYHLALETSFLVDEGVDVPELRLKSPLSVALPDKKSKNDRSISTVSGFLVPTSSRSQVGHRPHSHVDPLASTLVSPCSDCSTNLNEPGFRESLPAASFSSCGDSSCVSSTANSIKISPFSSEEGTLIDAGNTKAFTTATSSRRHELIGGVIGRLPRMTLEKFERGISGLSASLRQVYLEGSFTENTFPPSLAKFSHGDNNNISSLEDSLMSCPQLPCGSACLADARGAETQLERMDSSEPHLVSQINNHDDEGQEFSQEDFPPSPSDHQSILVSFSSSCLRKGTICERGHLFRIKYYGTFDKPLGRFLRDTTFDQTRICQACGELKDAHVDCYTHRQGSLTISVHKQSEVLPGESEGKIWMWHRCLKCPRIDSVPPATRRLVMSDAAWGLSFGKFLELSFSNHAAASRVASCGHSLHRDCLRFYGFGGMVACFRYSPVNVYSVYLPPSKLEFHHSEQQGWLQQEIYEVTQKGERFFTQAIEQLLHIKEEVLISDTAKVTEAKRRISELEALLLKQKEKLEAALRTAAPQCLGAGESHADILELNFIRQIISRCHALWDSRIQSLSNFLKSSKSATGFDLNLLGDSFFSFLKDISFRSSKNLRADESNEVSSVPDANLEGSNLIHCCITGSSTDDATVPTNACKIEKIRPVYALGSASDTIVNRSACSSCVDVGPKKDSVEEVFPSEGSLALSKDKMREVINDPQRVSFLDVAGEDSLLTSSRLSGNGFWLVKSTSNSPKNLEVGIGVHRTLSEGHFSAFKDLSATFDAAWIGKGQIVESHGVDISSREQEVSSFKPGSEIVATTEGSDWGSKRSGSEASDEGSTEYHMPRTSYGILSSSQDSEVTGVDSQLASTLTSPAKAGEPSDIEGWVGAVYSSLSTPYSRSTQSPLTSSSPKVGAEALSTSPSAPHLEHAAEQEGRGKLFPGGVNDTVVFVYDDELTSIIAYAITSQEHQVHLSDGLVDKDKQKDKEKGKDKEKTMLDHCMSDGGFSHPLQVMEGGLEPGDNNLKDRSSISEESIFSSSSVNSLDDALLHSKAMHIKVSFTDDTSQGKIKYNVTCYYAKQFDALRKKCCTNEMDFIRSLCRCKKWGAQGGKSNVFFAKTADDRFVVKQVTKTELESFLTFAPAYFKYISDALISGSPTCLAKILGIYQVIVKHGKGGKEVRMDLMVMENLLYGRHVTRIYDLKGSLRSRYNADATGKNAVLLDQNLLESMQTNPIFISNKAKRLLERAVWNDTAFLASVDVMDYSLLVGVDEERRDLVLGIIDFMRQYTWDKHLETWVKASGILGGPKNASPTIISPKQYKKRFRKAMSTYFLMVPDQWSPPTVVSGPPHIDAVDEGSLIATKDEVVDDSGTLNM